MPTILMIDDDEELCAVLHDYLAGFGLTLEAAHLPSAGLARLKAGGVDLVLLDVMLPEHDGFAVCRMIRDRGEILPIVMLTARGDVVDRVVGLELGADDYLPKPFEPRELVARIRTVLRRREPLPAAPAQGLRLDDGARDAWLDGRRLELTTMEYGLLALLAGSPGKTFSRDDIMDALRGIEADVFSRAVDVLVSRLRGKLGDDGKPPRFIKTVWGRGYAWVGQP